MAGVETMHFRVWKNIEIGLAAFRGEEDVALAPENERLRLLLLQKGLPLGIKLDIRAIVIEEIELNLFRARPLKKVNVHVPVVRADKLGPGMPVGVNGLDGVRKQERADGFFRFGRAVLPVVAAQLIPSCCKANLVGIRVLYD